MWALNSGCPLGMEDMVFDDYRKSMNIDQFIETFKGDFSKDAKEKGLLENHFTCGYCYHFAIILESLFKSEACLSGIVYNPVENHFAFYYNRKFYDITGEIQPDGNWFLWEYYQQVEPIDAGRVIEQCCYKVYVG